MVCNSGMYSYLGQGGAVIYLLYAVRIIHGKSIEMLLGPLQNVVYRGSLGEYFRVKGRKTQGIFTFHHSFAKSNSDGGDTLFGLHPGKGVIIKRLDNPGEGRIKSVAILTANRSLNNDGHFFALYPVAHSSAECFRCPEES